MNIAILKISNVVDSMKPLIVAAKGPGPGEKVYAVGNPGMGDYVLTQSITDGIISSDNRKIDGVKYLQHTAAVNPGNSGGPLIDNKGRVVGVITLKGRLENVSFAIPAETIRSIFNGTVEK